MKRTYKQLKWYRLQLIMKHSRLLNEMNALNFHMKEVDKLLEHAKREEATKLMNQIIRL